MNDPHVVALIYQVEHGRSVDYRRAKPLDHEEAGFRIKIENNQVRFEFTDHYATQSAARKSIEDYIREWEFVASLRGGLNYFKLRFDRAQIEDRNPTPGAVELHGGTTRVLFTTSKACLVVAPPCYPPPPSGVKRSPDVEVMYSRYLGYRQGQEPLWGMAYFCLTVLEGRKGRQAAARKYQIAKAVLKWIGYLSSETGDQQARKESGRGRKLTDQEHRFLEEATKAVIYRAAEKAHDPDNDLPRISLSDLPPV